jgi:DUF1365 family protein
MQQGDYFLGLGEVYHERFYGDYQAGPRPGQKAAIKNAFRYPVFYLSFDCKHEAAFSKVLKRRFFHFISFHAADHLCKEKKTSEVAISDFLKEYCSYETESVWLHTMPRCLGVVFNPVSFWLCWREKNLEAILLEVNNTFGERHFYWVYPQTPIEPTTWLTFKKVFHVSPFMPVEGTYKMRIRWEDLSFHAEIDYYGKDENLHLRTSTSSRLVPVESLHFFQLVWRYGWMPFMVLARIHAQAWRLWRKKAKFYHKPAPPVRKVST